MLPVVVVGSLSLALGPNSLSFPSERKLGFGFFWGLKNDRKSTCVKLGVGCMCMGGVVG